jgi:hypothetical protein
VTDGTPRIRIGDATVGEGHNGSLVASFTVSLTVASDQTITINYLTADGTALAASDYQSASGTVTFAPGERSQTITVLVNGDRLAEPNETFVVNLSSPINATIADGEGVATIVDDEPRVWISDLTMREGNRKKLMHFTFTVTLSVASDQPVTMSFKTRDDTATTANNDYDASSGTLTFAPGETTKTITIKVKGDNTWEFTETFYLDLFGLSSNAMFAKSRGVGRILNDD